MNSKILPINPTAAAAIADVDSKKWSTVRAYAALIGMQARRSIDDEGRDVVTIGTRKFASVEAALDWLRADE